MADEEAFFVVIGVDEPAGDAVGDACAWKELPNNLLCIFSVPEVIYDFTELFEGGFGVVDDFLGEDVEISNITPDPLTSRVLSLAFWSQVLFS